MASLATIKTCHCLLFFIFFNYKSTLISTLPRFSFCLVLIHGIGNWTAKLHNRSSYQLLLDQFHLQRFKKTRYSLFY